MNKLVTRALVSTLLTASSLGLAVAVTAPAGAAAKAHKAKPAVTKSYGGKVKSADVKKDTFTLVSGSKTYVVDFTSATKFSKGTPTDLKTGVAVVVTGKLVKTTIEATAIKA